MLVPEIKAERWNMIARAGIQQDFFTHFKTNPKSVGIYRLLRCCVLKEIKIFVKS